MLNQMVHIVTIVLLKVRIEFETFERDHVPT
jgi:hypothetical protein